MRQSWYAQKIWSQYHKKQMERLMKTHRETETAFLQIRACAGNDDVKEIVAKFMTREQSYTQLLRSVQSNEAKYEVLKAQNIAK